MSDREVVKRRIDELSPMGVRFVARMVDAMANPPQPELASQPTWICLRPVMYTLSGSLPERIDQLSVCFRVRRLSESSRGL